MSGRRNRPRYRHRELRRLLHPESIAIVGVSPAAGAFGARTVDHLRDYRGRIHLVNPKYSQRRAAVPRVAGSAARGSRLRRHRHRAALRRARRTRMRSRRRSGAIVYASGYAETGKPQHVADQQILAAIARETGVPMLGPNCIGYANYVNDAIITLAGVPHRQAPLPAHAIGLVSQSGAMAFALGNRRITAPRSATYSRRATPATSTSPTRSRSSPRSPVAAPSPASSRAWTIRSG